VRCLPKEKGGGAVNNKVKEAGKENDRCRGRPNVSRRNSKAKKLLSIYILVVDGRHAVGLELCGVRGSAALCRACLGQCCRPTQNAEPNPFVFCRSVRNFQVRALARVPASPLRAASN